MANSYAVTLGGFGRHVTDPNGSISYADVSIWKQAAHVLNKIRYTEPELTNLDIDWSEVVAHSEETYRISTLPPQELVDHYRKVTSPRPSPQIRITVDGERARPIYVEHFLYQAFLSLNLACPGSLNLFRAHGPVKNGLDIEVSLGAILFDIALLDSENAGVTIRKDIPLEDVWCWLNAVTSPTRQVAKTGIERALYGLLNLSTEDAYNPDCLMWLTHILEGLYDTSIGASFNSLRQRAISVLSIPEAKQKDFSRRLRKFYDVRSAFVHGGLDIEHPLGIDGWDKTCHEYRSTLMDAIDFAMLVALSTIQTMVSGNWQQLSFNETWSGCMIPNTGKLN